LGYNYRTIESTKPGTVCRRCGRWINTFHGHDDWVTLRHLLVFGRPSYLRYRGRKLGQAVKVVALRYAREVLKASSVHTHHNTKNLPMIAIDRKLGYTQIPGSFSMEKVLS